MMIHLGAEPAGVKLPAGRQQPMTVHKRRERHIIMTGNHMPSPSNRRSSIEIAFAKNQKRHPNMQKALAALGRMKGYQLPRSTYELDLDIIGGIGSGQYYKGRVVIAEDVEMRLAANPHVDKINVTLDSPGGSVVAAQKIYNALRSHGAFVDIVVDGHCASAAIQILLAGDLRQAWDYSEIMIHAASLKPKRGARLTAEYHRKLAEQVERTDKLLIDLFVDRTGTPRERFVREFRNENSMSLPTAISLNVLHTMVGDVDWKHGRPYFFPRV